MTESPASVVQQAARDSSIKTTFRDLSNKVSGRHIDSHLLGGVESDWRFQRGSIDAFINGNRDFINYQPLLYNIPIPKEFRLFSVSSHGPGAKSS